MELPAGIVMRDNDGKFQGGFDDVLRSRGIEIHRTAPRSPNLRAHVERFIQTFKQDCLQHFVVVSRTHLDHISREFAEHYNRERPHSSRGHLPPERDADLGTTSVGEVVCDERLGGLLRSYRRAA